MNSKVLSMLGMAKKAGKAASGEFACDKSVKDGSSCLVIIANDASDNTKKSIQNSCAYYQVKYFMYADMESIGRFTGGGSKAAATVNDENFANAILKKYSEELSIDKSVE